MALTTTRTKILDAWHAAFKRWEEGKDASPSESDLIALAMEHDDEFLDRTGFGDVRDAEDALYNLLEDGWDLEPAYDRLFGD